MRAERNEVLDQQSLIVRYQQQMAALRAHLRRVSSASAACSVHDPMHPEACDLLHRGRNVQQPTPEAAKPFWPNPGLPELLQCLCIQLALELFPQGSLSG